MFYFRLCGVCEWFWCSCVGLSLFVCCGAVLCFMAMFVLFLNDCINVSLCGVILLLVFVNGLSRLSNCFECG